jgi:hypothetical protein
MACENSGLTVDLKPGFNDRVRRVLLGTRDGIAGVI